MALSNDLISQFVKTTRDTPNAKQESTVYGTVVEIDGEKYVAIDGSDLRTPVTSTTDAKNGDRVTVMIKDHSATVTGNISSPSVNKDTTDPLGSKITEVEILVAGKVSTKDLEATNGRIDNLVTENVEIKKTLTANEAAIDTLTAADVTITGKLDAANASIKTLETEKLDANVADITYATIDKLNATDATVNNLNATYATFSKTVTDSLEAHDAKIKILDAGQITVDELETKFANIDFANIGEAAFKKLFADTGILEKVIISNGQVTGELVGVTIRGDTIIGGTIVADKLVIRNSKDGLFYKLNMEGGATLDETITEEKLQNGLSGQIIVAKSITAEKVAVDDLVAFGATIGGINIKDGCVYSGVKGSVGNTNDGFYLDKEGQIAVGNSNSYLKFFKDTTTDVNGNPVTAYKLAIAADSFIFASTGQTVDESIDNVSNNASDLTNQAIETSKAHTDDALKNYVDAQAFQDYQKSVAVLIENLQDGLHIAVTENSQNKEAIDKNADAIKDTQNNLSKHFDFKTDGLTIRAGDNSTALTLDSDDISFAKGTKGSGTWDGDDFYTRNVIIKPDGDETYKLQLGTFAFMPRKNGSLSFGKVGG